MAGFLSPLKIEEVDGDDRRWVLLEPCEYFLKGPYGDERVVAEAGFETDFGSIPEFLWGVPGLSPFGKLRRAYVIHDKLYFDRLIIRSDGRARLCDRAEADRVLLEAITVLGANVFQRASIYAGVRIGGGRPWDAHRARELATV